MIATGCSQRRKTTTISGKVTYNGKPVTVGAIYFHGDGDQLAMAPIHKDGSFTATDVPIGDVKVSLRVQDPGVYAQKLSKGGDAPQIGDPADGTAGVTSIPPKYADVESSGLTYSINAKTTSLEVNLVD